MLILKTAKLFASFGFGGVFDLVFGGVWLYIGVMGLLSEA
jgi:hypothetical protein